MGPTCLFLPPCLYQPVSVDKKQTETSLPKSDTFRFKQYMYLSQVKFESLHWESVHQGTVWVKSGVLKQICSSAFQNVCSVYHHYIVPKSSQESVSQFVLDSKCFRSQTNLIIQGNGDKRKSFAKRNTGRREAWTSLFYASTEQVLAGYVYSCNEGKINLSSLHIFWLKNIPMGFSKSHTLKLGISLKEFQEQL